MRKANTTWTKPSDLTRSVHRHDARPAAVLSVTIFLLRRILFVVTLVARFHHLIAAFHHLLHLAHHVHHTHHSMHALRAVTHHGLVGFRWCLRRSGRFFRLDGGGKRQGRDQCKRDESGHLHFVAFLRKWLASVVRACRRPPCGRLRHFASLASRGIAARA